MPKHEPDSQLRRFELKHECGIAMVRLRKPFDYYRRKYGTWAYGLDKLYLLMEKQHNRGQEGAGMACVKLDAQAGEEFVFRERAEGSSAIETIFGAAGKQIAASQQGDPMRTDHVPFAGQIYMGHLRYSTTGRLGLSFVHPFMRRSNYRTQTLTLCGNFNLTNVREIFKHISDRGQHPRQQADTFILLEQLGHRLDREVERIYEQLYASGLRGLELTREIERKVDIARVLSECAPMWDGGYVICGMTGSGDQFTLRDPWGIRPCFYYIDDEAVVVASERPVIQTAMNLDVSQVEELLPGQALIVNSEGAVSLKQIITPTCVAPCSFERIYFSRGSDADIYRERKQLGANLVPQVLDAIDGDLKNTVISFIPNTAEVAYNGLVDGLNEYINHEKAEFLIQHIHSLTQQEIEDLLAYTVHTEKVALKDIKLRTFITQQDTRNDMAAHVYDVTYGTLRPHEDNLVVIDDSIVRGTTLRQSIIRMLARLNPKKIVILSSAPQIRYPDFYGIDMASLDEFIAFKAAVALTEEQGHFQRLNDIYQKCVNSRNGDGQTVNHVSELYEPFTDEQISAKIAQLLMPEGITIPIQIIYQTIDGLHQAIPNHQGDWYFSGRYPTPGGCRMCNEAFIRYMEKR
ncbi:MAG: amidophosphoribosyltransferase [Paludibacteraceae bacterium]|nr:amidophosphoribosyltransferase [Paludibacteraceae bacterium]